MHFYQHYHASNLLHLSNIQRQSECLWITLGDIVDTMAIRSDSFFCIATPVDDKTVVCVI